MTDHPIAVISYNQPDLLRAFLASLKEQTCPVNPARVALFQDHGGPTEGHSVAALRGARRSRWKPGFPLAKPGESGPRGHNGVHYVI